MATETSISWCDHTFNGWVGCMKVSPACDGCYAEFLMDTRMGRVTFGGPGKGIGTRSRTGPTNWKDPLKWNRKAKTEGRRPFVFCSSLSDVFDKHVPAEWRKDLFDLIRQCDQLVWLLLTKRPQLIVKLADEAGGLPPNVALGTTVEDQLRAEQNLPALQVAKIELKPLFIFGSFEPLLGEVIVPPGCMPDWVISGGETDQGEHKARPTHPDWFRSLRDQAERAGVAYHHKQNGEWIEPKLEPFVAGKIPTLVPRSTIHIFPDGTEMHRVGKKHSGRTLDGKIHDAFPEV